MKHLYFLSIIKKIVLVVTISIFCLGCQVAIPIKILNTPTPVSPDPTKQVVSISLPLIDRWRWTGLTFNLMVITPKDQIVVAGDYWDGEKIVVFDAHTGSVIWESGYISNLRSLNADNKRVYIGTVDYVRAYDLDTGQELWEGAEQPEFKRGGLSVYPKGNQLEVYDLHDGYMYLLDTETGRTIEKIQQTLPFFRKDDIFYSGTCGAGYKLNCLDVTDMVKDKLLWSNDFGGSVYRWPIFIDTTMFVNAGGKLYAVNTETGDIIWKSLESNLVTTLALGNDLLYAIRDDAAIVGFDPKTGKLVGSVEMIPSQTPRENSGGYTTYYTIAASDNFVAAYYGISQELIVFEIIGNDN